MSQLHIRNSQVHRVYYTHPRNMFASAIAVQFTVSHAKRSHTGTLMYAEHPRSLARAIKSRSHWCAFLTFYNPART